MLTNLDHIAGVMAQEAPQVEVRGIADSGWFLDNEQYKKAMCNDAHSCSPTESIKRGFQYVCPTKYAHHISITYISNKNDKVADRTVKKYCYSLLKYMYLHHQVINLKPSMNSM